MLIAKAALPKGALERVVVAIKAIVHDSLESNVGWLCTFDQFQCDLRLGVEVRVLLAASQAAFRRVPTAPGSTPRWSSNFVHNNKLLHCHFPLVDGG